jgi:hypothetical protein
MTTDLDTGIEYYKDLLLYQYINQPKARQTIGLLVSQALVDLLPVEINNAFNLETAVGPQFDIIGQYIGLDRVIEAIIVRDYFTLDDYTSPLTSGAFGFTDYTVPTQNISASFYLYIFFDTPTNSLEDNEYRLLLKLKSYLNSSLLSVYEINNALSELFGKNGVFCADQTDMTLSYFVSEELSRIVQIAYNEALLPKPMGVLISGLFSFSSVDDLWGLTDYVKTSGSTIGFSSYTAWADATMLDYNNRIA